MKGINKAGNKARQMKTFFILFLGNVLSQGYLIMLTGTFWDDWCYYYHDIDRVWNQFIQTGRPSLVYIPAAFWKLPHFGYRWVIFLCYFMTSIMIYLILNNVSFFQMNLTKLECTAISLVYTAIPVNDARACMVNMPFTVSLLLFLSGFYFLSMYMERNSRHFRFRIIALVLFFGSFITNSMLVFYFLPILYIFCWELYLKNNFMKTVRDCLRYADFFLLPFVFYAAKTMLFPAYGIYEGYNLVTFSKMANAVKLLPKAVCYVMLNAFKEFFILFSPLSGKDIWIIFAVLGGILLFLKKFRKKKAEQAGKERLHDMAALGTGILAVILGLYPYIVVSQTEYIRITGVYGRYSLLVPIGMAVSIFYGFRIICKNSHIHLAICAVFIMFGNIACNLHYLNYQIDAYFQESLIEKLKENEFIKNEKNILFISSSLPATDSTRFYSLNGDASVAYGNQSRLFMNGFGDLDLLKKDISYLVQFDYLMNDYDCSYKELDGIIVFNFDISYRECLELKYLELTDKSRFLERVSSKAEFAYYPAGSREAVSLLK